MSDNTITSKPLKTSNIPWTSETEYNEYNGFKPYDDKKGIKAYSILERRTRESIMGIMTNLHFVNNGTIALGFNNEIVALKIEPCGGEGEEICPITEYLNDNGFLRRNPYWKIDDVLKIDNSLYLTDYQQEELKKAQFSYIEAQLTGWRPYYEVKRNINIQNGQITNTQSTFEYADEFDQLPKQTKIHLRKIMLNKFLKDKAFAFGMKVDDVPTLEQINELIKIIKNKFDNLTASEIALVSVITGIENVQDGFDYILELFLNGDIDARFNTKDDNGNYVQTKNTEIEFFPNSPRISYPKLIEKSWALNLVKEEPIDPEDRIPGIIYTTNGELSGSGLFHDGQPTEDYSVINSLTSSFNLVNQAELQPVADKAIQNENDIDSLDNRVGNVEVKSQDNENRSLTNEANILVLQDKIGRAGVYQTNSSIVNILTTPSYIKPDITKNITDTTILDIDETLPNFTKYIVKVNDVNVEFDLVGELLKVGNNDSGTINVRISSNSSGFVYYQQDLVFDFPSGSDFVSFNERIRFKIDDTRPINEELFLTFQVPTANDIVDIKEYAHIDVVVDGGGSTSGTLKSSKVVDDASTEPAQGINPWKEQIDINKLNIGVLEDRTQFDAGNGNYGKMEIDQSNGDVILESENDDGINLARVEVRINQNSIFLNKEFNGGSVDYLANNPVDLLNKLSGDTFYTTKEEINEILDGTTPFTELNLNGKKYTSIVSKPLHKLGEQLGWTDSGGFFLNRNWDTEEMLFIEVEYNNESPLSVLRSQSTKTIYPVGIKLDVPISIPVGNNKTLWVHLYQVPPGNIKNGVSFEMNDGESLGNADIRIWGVDK